jgi:hypothetical protein
VPNWMWSRLSGPTKGYWNKYGTYSGWAPPGPSARVKAYIKRRYYYRKHWSAWKLVGTTTVGVHGGDPFHDPNWGKYSFRVKYLRVKSYPVQYTASAVYTAPIYVTRWTNGVLTKVYPPPKRRK